jgi:CheY-like chemotaxis protein
MKNKKHVLVVEDNSFIYRDIKEVLLDAGFSVSKYTPSVKEAIARINKQRPDIVLLDIDLKGEHNGIYLGNLLKTEYHIPFIYVTDYDDDFTFNQSSQTSPEAFISKRTLKISEEDVVIKTKPHFDEKHLIQQMILILQRYEKQPTPLVKKGIWAYVDYPKNIQHLGNEDVSRVQVTYRDIAYFTTNSLEVDEEKTEQYKTTKYIKMKENTVRLCTWEDKSYIVNHNLKPVAEVLPHYFMRISDEYVVNLNDELLDGRINGRRLKIRGKVFTISERFKSEVEKRLNTLYQKMEKKKR